MQTRDVQLSVKSPSFGLSSEQCELLLAFEVTGSLSELSALVRRDVSAVSRALQKVAQTVPVLEKHQGRWQLTALGREINNWTRDAADAQRRVLQQRTLLRIAGTREFATRVLAPKLAEFSEMAPNTQFSILTSESGVEGLLLSGDADIGFDCGKPTDPGVRFRSVNPHGFSVVASPRFIKAHKIKVAQDLLAHPYLQYKRASATRLLQLPYEVPNVGATFNDIAVLREACAADLGWAIVPTYTVRKELSEGRLDELKGFKIATDHFGVWWLRGRSGLDPWVNRAVKWLSKQQL